MVDTETGVLNIIQNFYKELYTTRGDINYSYLDSLDIPKISQEDRQLMDCDIELDEISLALKQLNNEKSTGSDGIPLNLLKVFWAKLKEFFYGLYSEIIRDQKLHKLHLTA